MAIRPGARAPFLVSILLLYSAPSWSAPQEGENKVRTQSADEAGADFQLQGEYVGSYRRELESELFGVQVIARGRGAFDAVAYPGGLPGAGWSRGQERLHLTGEREGNQVVLRGSDDDRALLVVIDPPRMQVLDSSGIVLGRLERVVRKSKTLGRAPPEGALVLFDGTTAKHFQQHKDGKPPAAMTPEGFLRLTAGSGGLETKQTFQSCRLHLEFRLPFEPEGRGQSRGNSGCYLQSRYEVQILDSFGLEGVDHECGGIYKVADPRVNMCFPPLSWQTYDIDFTAPEFDSSGAKTKDARMTVHHNGVLIHEDQALFSGWTTAAPEKNETPQAKPHYLQDHGHEIFYRNIWLVKK